MNRPRNRQPRRGNDNRDSESSPRSISNSSSSHQNNAAQSYRGRGQGSRPYQRPSSLSTRPIPTIDQLAANTPVSIVLKQDQPTGRQVQGFVAEVLTSGNHPRGIKVRLTDGRVGRVQGLASAEEAESGTSSDQLGRNGEMMGREGARSFEGQTSARATVAYHDVRTDGYDYDYEQQERSGPSLEDYIVSKAPRGRRKGAQAADASSGSPAISGNPSSTLETHDDSELGDGSKTAAFNSATTVCPVCHTFEGDEDAVAHHVASHFD
ncbi:hypothetical protein NA57DRAFT_32421 [Rhizodiscina lignyota]|uniref:Uncharacterized protein n=1 Tax=Rhizodiscina lignyota TaxID=1504668 RepID=A0A9P4MA64_9PEZI|nr:hypothetical protein NA57DRAFT_32421 [Rhizodiscina lignyota]